MKSKKGMVLVLLAVVLLAALMAGAYCITRPEAVSGSKTFTVDVVHKDGSRASFTYHTHEEFVGPALTAEGLIEGEEGPYGLYVTAVDGEQADYDTDQSYWAFYENGEYATQGIYLTPVLDGAHFSLEYTIG